MLNFNKILTFYCIEQQFIVDNSFSYNHGIFISVTKDSKSY